MSSTDSAVSILDDSRTQERERIVELLTKAYWMEIELAEHPAFVSPLVQMKLLVTNRDRVNVVGRTLRVDHDLGDRMVPHDYLFLLGNQAHLLRKLVPSSRNGRDITIFPGRFSKTLA